MQAHIQEKGAATLKELHTLFPDVSLMTIHRDLDFLEANGFIHRVHGGAQAVGNLVEPGFEARENENSAYKRKMAQKALHLIKPGNAIFLDSGTTCSALAEVLPDTDISVFTTGPNIALTLMRLNKPSVNICGGSINRANLAVSGQSTLDMLKNVNIDTAFIGAGGYSSASGFTGGRESEAKVKELVIRKARTVVAMVDSSKLSRILPFTFARLADFHIVVDDGRLPDDFLEEARKLNITVI